MDSNYRAQIIKLGDNVHGDDEIILFCSDFYDLYNLLKNPVIYFQKIGLLWDDPNWTLKTPVTAIINPDEADTLTIFGFSTALSLHDVSDFVGLLGEDESAGGFVAQFARNTHTILIRYVRPSAAKIQPRNTDVEFTRPNTIKINDEEGSVHFDIMAKSGSKMTLDELRAQHIVDYIARPDENCWNLLNKFPLETSPSSILAPHEPVLARVGPPASEEHSFSQSNQIDASLVVEGILETDPVVVCLLSGASWNGTDWILNGKIVKNYVAPGGGG